MKAKMLKIAGVKSEKEFYKKFPTEEAFMAKHGGEFRKAQAGYAAAISNPAFTNAMQGIGSTQMINPNLLGAMQNVTTSAANYQNSSFKPPSMGDYVTPLKEKAKIPGLLDMSIIGVGIDLDRAIKERKKAKTFKNVSEVVKQASTMRQDLPENQYVRPEDVALQADQMGMSPYGTGFDVLGAARDGMEIGGTPTEIQNMYNPGTLYDNLGYEPLDESDRMKQFKKGGDIPMAQAGLETMAIQTAVQVAPMIRQFQLDKTIGRATKKWTDQANLNLQQAAVNQALQNQFSSYMKDGGTLDVSDEYKWVSNSWQPQVIATFGEHKVSDLLRPPKDADMLRAGGHLKEYTPPSERAMSTERPDFQMGGELKTHWGGYAEPMSYNPYLPEGGETVMFKGQSHEESDGKGNTGIGVTFGDNPVEVERNEPAMKMKDGSSGDSSLVVFGNLKVPKGMLPGADGLNFKKYVANLSKSENKANKMVDKAIEKLDELDVITPYDRLSFNTLKAQIDGGNAKLKDIAQNKMDAAALQTAINDTVEEYGLETTDKGTIMAKKGAKIPKAQTGEKTQPRSIQDLNKDVMTVAEWFAENQNRLAENFYPSTDPLYKKMNLDKKVRSLSEKASEYKKNPNIKLSPDQQIYLKQYIQRQNYLIDTINAYNSALKSNKNNEPIVQSKKTKFPTTVSPSILERLSSAKPAAFVPPAEKPSFFDRYSDELMFAANQLLPYVRPSDVEGLDPNQLAGEALALTTNQLEPVQAQQFRPQLATPYSVSLQDIMNENEATFRAQQRLVGYNPALQSELAAQKYAANQKVLGEQFRMNQSIRDQISRENTNLLNQAQLQNLGILDRQYVRQAEAKSKTKATTQAALNSIAAKYAQNRLENRTLQVFENMYNYRFGPNFRAQNYQLAQFNIPNVYTAPDGKKYKMVETDEKSKNGSIVKALKNL
jgi:hypothetical protein